MSSPSRFITGILLKAYVTMECVRTALTLFAGLMLFAGVMCKLQGNASHLTKHLKDNFYRQPSEGLHLPRSYLTSNRRHNQSHGLIQVIKAAIMD